MLGITPLAFRGNFGTNLYPFSAKLLVMTRPSNSSVQQETLNNNRVSINSFLKDSYNQAKKQLGEGVLFIQDGVSYIKDEFSDIYDKTGHYVNRMVLPVNNFLKDLTQIDTELRQEVCKESAQFLTLDGKLVPVDQVLLQPMEENY